LLDPVWSQRASPFRFIGPKRVNAPGIAFADLPPIDFVAFAKACGADGFSCSRPDEVRPAIEAALRSPRAALVEAWVNPEEKPAKPDELKV